MGVVSWNANRINEGRLTDMVIDLVEGVGRCIFLLQEVGSCSDDPGLSGWRVVHATGASSAVLVPRELALSFRHEGEWQMVRLLVAVTRS